MKCTSICSVKVGREYSRNEEEICKLYKIIVETETKNMEELINTLEPKINIRYE